MTEETPLQKMLRHRMLVMKEIVSTEQTYLSQLTTLVELFVKPIKANKKLNVTPAQVKTLFSQSELILQTSQLLFAGLEKSLQNGGAGIGAIFKEMSSYLKFYTPYIYNLKNAQEMSNNLMSSNKKFKEFITKTEQNPECKGYHLSTYLVLPVQRIPRYELLLKELIKKTPDTDPEKPVLETALEKIKEVAMAVNDMKRTVESGYRLVEIRDSIVDITTQAFLIPSRKYVYESQVHLISRTMTSFETGTPKTETSQVRDTPAQLYLFNDALFYAQIDAQQQRRFGEFIPIHFVTSLTTSSSTQTGFDQTGQKEVDQLEITLRLPIDFDTKFPGGADVFQGFFKVPPNDESTYNILTLKVRFNEPAQQIEMKRYLQEEIDTLRERRTKNVGGLTEVETHHAVTETSQVGQQTTTLHRASVAFPGKTMEPIKQPLNMATQKEKRTEGIIGIIREEEQYITRLQNGVKYYLQPLIEFVQKRVEKTPIPNEKDIRSVFGDIPYFIQTHSLMLKDMQRLEKEQKTDSIGVEVFKVFSDYLKVYGIYISSLEERQNRIALFCENDYSLSVFLNELEQRKEMDGFTLNQFLEIPRDRLNLYSTQIFSLMQQTEGEEALHKQFNDAKVAIDRVIEDVDKKVKVTEAKQRVVRIVMSMEGIIYDASKLAPPNRSFVCEQECLHIASINEQMTVLEANIRPHFIRDYNRSLAIKCNLVDSSKSLGPWRTIDGLPEPRQARAQSVFLNAEAIQLRWDSINREVLGSLVKYSYALSKKTQLFKDAKMDHRMKAAAKIENSAIRQQIGCKTSIFLFNDSILTAHMTEMSHRHYADFFNIAALDRIDKVKQKADPTTNTPAKYVLRLSVHRKRSNKYVTPSENIFDVSAGAETKDRKVAQTEDSGDVSRLIATQRETDLDGRNNISDTDFYCASFQFKSEADLDSFYVKLMQQYYWLIEKKELERYQTLFQEKK
ncbi:putative Guanine exchange factor for Rac 30 [Blattamonas nauphoetae]|uniref:Guanine exchange factor for Rac 30 n=1 Tax=Blattamonas nauphoetae TaxID=2049346 RepID=A0ABQ9YEE0_9EUKA|nr:putative Guanine exchange factor for Rac 30 [Blattamonas nauphoetae]